MEKSNEKGPLMDREAYSAHNLNPNARLNWAGDQFVGPHDDSVTGKGGRLRRRRFMATLLAETLYTKHGARLER